MYQHGATHVATAVPFRLRNMAPTIFGKWFRLILRRSPQRQLIGVGWPVSFWASQCQEPSRKFCNYLWVSMNSGPIIKRNKRQTYELRQVGFPSRPSSCWLAWQRCNRNHCFSHNVCVLGWHYWNWWIMGPQSPKWVVVVIVFVHAIFSHPLQNCDRGSHSYPLSPVKQKRCVAYLVSLWAVS